MANPIHATVRRTGGSIGRGGGAGAVRGGVRIYGLPELIAKMNAVDSITRVRVGAMLSAAAVHTQTLAKQYVPKRTTNLETGIIATKLASYTWNVSASSMDGSDPGGEYKNDYEYAPFVEYGTSNMEGSFFMTRAFQETKPLVAVELQALAKAIERI